MIIIKTPQEIDKMRHSNRVVVETLNELLKHIKPGVTTLELDAMAESMLLNKGAKPAFKGYRGFPCTLCASVNEEVVHGIPSKRRLKEGDIISLDLGALCDGYYGDSALTVGVGSISQEAERLMEVTRQALYVGIRHAKEGKHLSDLSNAVQGFVESYGYSVVRAFVGHGIGQSLHEDPQIPNFGPPGMGPKLRKGMVLAIEPMVNMGSYEVQVLGDNWTVVTADRALSAHFEHTVALTDSGAEILTLL